jgi:hypothetical protein
MNIVIKILLEVSLLAAGWGCATAGSLILCQVKEKACEAQAARLSGNDYLAAMIVDDGFCELKKAPRYQWAVAVCFITAIVVAVL